MEKTTLTKESTIKILFEIFKILKERENGIEYRELLLEIENRVPLTKWEKEIYEVSRDVRWKTNMRFASACCVKAGYIKKENGVWSLTSAGEAAMHLGPDKLADISWKIYDSIYKDENKK